MQPYRQYVTILKVVAGGAGSLVLDRRRFASMSSYNFFMPYQEAIALKNP